MNSTNREREEDILSRCQSFAEYSATGNLGSIVSITESRLGSGVEEVHQP